MKLSRQSGLFPSSCVVSSTLRGMTILSLTFAFTICILTYDMGDFVASLTDMFNL